MLKDGRQFSLGIWTLGFGYFVFYTPYSALTKAITNGLLSADAKPVPGAMILPVSVVATVVTMFAIITAAGWWRYAGRRELFGLSVPFPNRWTFLSGLCIATIVGTTTLAFSFRGISILFVLVLLRGGVLIIGPIVDASLNRRVRWFSWTAMAVSLLALLVTLADVSNYTLTLFAVLDIAAYLLAYLFRLRLMTRLAKTDDRKVTLRYFVEEQIVATPILLIALAIFAAIGAGDTLAGLRRGFIEVPGSDIVVPAIMVGVFYAALCVCTTLIFLDRRENTFCVPMHCGSSMLSGVVATWLLTIFYGQTPPSAAQFASAGLIVVALLFLSPLHHAGMYVSKLNGLLARGWLSLRPTTERRRYFEEGGDGGARSAANALPAEMMARFSAITGLFTYFSIQLGDSVWRGKNVLDFGGSIGAILRDPDSTIDEERYWCLDVNKEAIERGKADYPRAHWVFYNRYCFEFNPLGIPNLPIPDLRQTFDYIIAFSVFTNNTVTDLLQLVGQLESMLAPRGALAFTFLDPFYPISPGQSVFHLRLERELEKGNITPAEMKDLLGRAQGAKWFILVNGSDLYIETEEIRRYEPHQKKSCYSYHTREYIKSLFPHAMILPPLNSSNNMRQACCVIRRS